MVTSVLPFFLTLTTKSRRDNQMRILELFKLCDTRIVTGEGGLSSSVTDVSQQFKLSAINDSRKFTLTFLANHSAVIQSHKRRRPDAYHQELAHQKFTIALLRPFDMWVLDRVNSRFYAFFYGKFINHQLNYINNTIYQLFPLAS